MSFTTLRKNLKITTYSKVVLLLAIITTAFIVLFSALFYYNFQQEKEYNKSSSEELEREMNSLLDLNADSYLSLINDISYWDELVNFIAKKDIRWFNASIAYLVDTNKVDYIDAYNLNLEFIAKVSTTRISTKNFIPKEIFAKLYKNRFIKFYMKVPEGIVQVYGATVHPSEDPFKNKTQPRGYFFIVKLIDSKYNANFENISGATIEEYNPKKLASSNSIFFIKEIKDYNNNKLSTLIIKRISKVDFETTRTILFIMIFAYLISLLLFLKYMQRWLKRPIKLIRDVLENGNPNSIALLTKTRGEYRYIGKLFEENNNKKIQLQKAKIKAEESDKLKSAFLMNLSHEVRTPMNAILGFSNLLLKSSSTDLEKKEYIKIIKGSGKNLIDIIDDLIEISKIETNQVFPKYSSVDLHTIVLKTYQSVKATTGSKKEIEFKLIPPTIQLAQNIVTDPEKLNKILYNLLSNAVKFTTEGFVVLQYKINKSKSTLDFSIKDSGIGIPDEKQDGIFKRFNKINDDKDTENSGLGLRLPMCKAYVEMLGGTISLQSQVNLGSTFSFSIPFVFDKNDALDLVKNNGYTNFPLDLGNKKIILIAEDDNLNFLLIEKLLKTLKINIIRAKNGVEAVAICEENIEIDLIFMDIKMPELDGHGAFLKIREFNKSIPIIAHSSYSFPEEIEKIQLTGFNDFISKPIDKKILFNLVEKYIGKYQGDQHSKL
jgi:signal transduction histidine kinase/CheY-like chemotaxis protein